MALIGVTALLTACGGGGSSAGSGSGAPALTGTPYKLFTIGDDTADHPWSDVIAAGEEAVKFVNANGGVDGHPLEIEFCNGQLDPNATLACANKAIADPSIVATVGNYMVVGTGATKAFEAAGMPQIGAFPVGQADYSSPMSFNTIGGGIVAVIAEGTALADVSKAKRLAFLGVDTPAARGGPDLLNSVLKSSGRDAQVVKSQFSPYGSADFSGVVAGLLNDDTEGVVMAMPLNMQISFLRAASSQGLEKPLSINLTNNILPELEGVGAAAENVIVSTWYRHDSAAYADIIARMEGSGNPTQNDTALTTWDSVILFSRLAKGMPTVDRASIAKAAAATTAYDAEGLVSRPVDFTSTFTGLGGTFPRIPNPRVYYGHLDADLKVVHDLDGAPVDIFAKPPTS